MSSSTRSVSGDPTLVAPRLPRTHISSRRSRNPLRTRTRPTRVGRRRTRAGRRRQVPACLRRRRAPDWAIHRPGRAIRHAGSRLSTTRVGRVLPVTRVRVADLGARTSRRPTATPTRRRGGRPAGQRQGRSRSGARHRRRGPVLLHRVRPDPDRARVHLQHPRFVRRASAGRANVAWPWPVSFWRRWRRSSSWRS